MNNQIRTSVVVLLSMLKQSDKIDRFSLVVTQLAIMLFIVMLFMPDLWIILGCFFIFIFALCQKYYAIRIGIDIHLFEYLLNHPDDLSAELTSIDQVLVDFKLKKVTNKPIFNLLARQKNTLRLLKKQGLYCISQWVFVLLIVFQLVMNLVLNID